MPRLPTLTPRDARERAVIAIWRDGGLSNGSIATYLGWVRRWRSHWADRGINEFIRLTLPGVLKFLSTIIGPRSRRRIGPASQWVARNSLHAWACALRILGEVVPCWYPTPPKRRLPALLQAYVEHRRSQRGVVAGTVRRDISVATEFLTTLRARGRTISTMRIVDIDDFVDGMLARLSRSYVGDRCSSLRQFLRFLRATGRLRQDLATAVVGPRNRVGMRPPRALPWADIQRILRAVPRRRPVDLRDHAMLLLLASYGMGSSEAASLRLEDINWAGKTLHVRRQKTGVSIDLPLSPSVARSLAAYLRRGRPRHCVSREVFVTVGLPHDAITASALRHRVHKYASLAGIPAELCSSHVFRHSHATRQIDLGAMPEGRQRHPWPPPSVVDVRIRSRCAPTPTPARAAGASMIGVFTSPLASALRGFLEFKRRRAHKYDRAEFMLRSFDRFLQTRAKQDVPWRLNEVILAWLASRPGRLAVSVSQEVTVIRQFWSYVRRHHPAQCRREIRWPKLPTATTFVPYILTVADVRELLRLASRLERPRFRRALYRALLLVLYCTGLRFGEALRLRIGDVDLHRDVIFVDEFKGRARWVPFHPSLRHELDRYLNARHTFAGSDPRQDDPFFLASDGRSLSMRAAHATLCRMFRTMGLKSSSGRVGPRPYDLRHTFAVHRLTRWYRERVDLQARLPWLSAYMGHMNLLGTETYLTATPELLALAAHRFRRRFTSARCL